ncbi:MAG: protoporphyrinogen oxidase [Balneolaceae bacterium]|nr:protoporphyrinogen oxidase [Balneolaceae bacterium]MDR9410850.1 protoporphyrinogen oxidase [Balneolaceae bacterium]
MEENKIAIVGAGITGLTAAWSLKRMGHKVELFEQHGYAGGSIKSVIEDGWLLEYGPNTLLLKDKKVADFLKELGIWEEKIIANPESSKRFIIKNGQLVKLPSSLSEAISTPLFSTLGKLAVLKEPFISKTDNQDETVAQFVKRRIGKEMLDYALNPFIAGIYANRPEKLSLRHTFPKMYELEQEYGSLIWGTFAGRKKRKSEGRIDRELISFNNGLHQIVETITDQLDEIYFNHQIKKIQKLDDGWYLKSKFGDKGPYEKVILNAPLYKWNKRLLPIQQEKHEEIETVDYPPLSVFHLGFKKGQVSHPLDGFGFLVPEKENRNILGALFSSTLFPGRAPADSHLLTVFVGGGRNPELAQKESQSLLIIVLAELEDLIGVTGEPIFKEHVFWPKSIPGYHVGYDRVRDAFNAIEKRNPGLHLAGNFRDGVSVPDCIKNGLHLAKELAD